MKTTNRNSFDFFFSQYFSLSIDPRAIIKMRQHRTLVLCTTLMVMVSFGGTQSSMPCQLQHPWLMGNMNGPQCTRRKCGNKCMVSCPFSRITLSSYCKDITQTICKEICFSGICHTFCPEPGKQEGCITIPTV